MKIDLDYFMNSDKNPPLSPVTDDLQIRYKDAGVADWHDAYGPYNIKVLRNYRGDGYYPQRNGNLLWNNCWSFKMADIFNSGFFRLFCSGSIREKRDWTVGFIGPSFFHKKS